MSYDEKLMVKAYYLALLLITSSFSCFSQDRNVEYLDSAFLAGVAANEFPGLSCAFVNEDTTWIGTYGVIETAREKQINSQTLFQLGSVGKLLTAISVMQQVEAGKLDINKDIGAYLELELSREEGLNALTLQHLLTHTAGMNDRNIGYLSRNSSSLVTLEQHLENNLPSFYQPAGQEINYSNYSYALAGYMVERTSGLLFQDYVKEKIFKPLGMNQSFVGFDFHYSLDSTYAKGHKRLEESFVVNTEYARHALPAGSFISSANDMQMLLSAFLNRDSVLLSSNSWSKLFSRQFSNHKSLTGYSLGMEEQQIGDQTFWAKGGMLTGYLSQVIMLPDNSALFIAINSSDDEFLEKFHANYLSEFYSSASTVSTTETEVQPNLSKYVGQYRNARYDRDGVENILSLFRGAFEIWEGESGLLAYHNGEMHNYQYAGDDIFVNQSNAGERMVFITDDTGDVIRLYRSVNIGGLSVPSTFEKTLWYNSPTFINEYYAIVLVIILLYSLPIMLVGLIHLVRVKKPDFWKWKLLPGPYYIIAFIGILCVVIHSMKAVVPLVKSPLEFLFGLPETFVIYNQFAWGVMLFSVASLLYWFSCLKSNKGSAISKLTFGLYSIAMILHTLTLMYWNFI